jgi:hypothetical protein
MAILWVDPYIESSHGGINGTTGSGSGTYASPWSISQTIGLSSGISTGDEVRFKGLAESTFFSTNNAWGGTSGNPVQWYYIQGQDQNKLIKATLATGDTAYLGMYSQTQIATPQAYGYWWAPVGSINTSVNYTIFDDNYAISSSSNTGFMFQNISVNFTITAGWDSSTTQNGITVIKTNPGNSLGSQPGIGNNSYRNIDINAPQLILDYWCYSSPYIYCNSLILKHFGNGVYNPGYYLNVTIGGGIIQNSKSGNANVSEWVGGGYTNFYVYNSGRTSSATVEVRLIFNLNFSYLLYDYSGAGYTTIFYQYYGLYNLSINNQTGGSTPLNITFLNGWNFEASYSPSININSNWVLGATIIGTQGTSYYSVQGENSFQYLQGPGYNNSLTSYQSSYTLYSNPNNMFTKVSNSSDVHRTYVGKYQLSGTDTLETVSFSPMYWNSTASYGTPMKINCFADSVSGRPCQFMSPTGTGDTIMVYNSTNYSGALTWHFYAQSNYMYADTFTLTVPNYATHNVTFTGTFYVGNPSNIQSITVTLYFWSLTSGLVAYNTYYPSVSSTVSISDTSLTSTVMQNYNVTQAYALVSVTKNGAGIAEMAFGTLTLS